jgi:hypothetical protein
MAHHTIRLNRVHGTCSTRWHLAKACLCTSFSTQQNMGSARPMLCKAVQTHRFAQVSVVCRCTHLLAHCASSAWGCTAPRALGAAASCLCQSLAALPATTPDAQAGLQPSTAAGCPLPLLQGANSTRLAVGWLHCIYLFTIYNHPAVHQVYPSPRSPRSARQHAPALQLTLLLGWQGP